MAEPHEQKSDLPRQLRHGRLRQGTSLVAFCLFVSILMPFRFVYCSGQDGHAGIRVSSLGRCCCCAFSFTKVDLCQANNPTTHQAVLETRGGGTPCCPSCVDVELPFAAGMKALAGAHHTTKLKPPCDSPSAPWAGEHFSREVDGAMHPPLVPVLPKTTEILSATILLI